MLTSLFIYTNIINKTIWCCCVFFFSMYNIELLAMINLITHVSRQARERTICCIIIIRNISRRSITTSSVRVFSLVRLARLSCWLFVFVWMETFYMHRLFGYELWKCYFRNIYARLYRLINMNAISEAMNTPTNWSMRCAV